MANTWTTLLDAVYPTGTLYFSTNSTSPATRFGGTWTQIEDAFIAAKGSAYITGTVAAYSGDKYQKQKHMPIHQHDLVYHDVNPVTAPFYMNSIGGYKWTNAVNKGNSDWYKYLNTDSDKLLKASYWADHQATEEELSFLCPHVAARDSVRMTGGGAKLRSLLLFYIHLAKDCLNFIAPKGVMNNG